LKLCVCIAVLVPVFFAAGVTSSSLEMTPPISGLALADTFEEVHNGHRHEAIDITGTERNT
jgi:hypothetical protein